MVGDFRGTIDFGDGALTSNGGDGENKPGGATPAEVAGGDIFLALFEADGNVRWSKSFGDDQPQFGRSIYMEPYGWAVTIAGDFFGNVDFGMWDHDAETNSSDIYDAAFVQ